MPFLDTAQGPTRCPGRGEGYESPRGNSASVVGLSGQRVGGAEHHHRRGQNGRGGAAHKGGHVNDAHVLLGAAEVDRLLLAARCRSDLTAPDAVKSSSRLASM